jgi:uncharacterized delta-60 repeat protein
VEWHHSRMGVIRGWVFRLAAPALVLIAMAPVAQGRLAQLDPTFGHRGIDQLGPTGFPAGVTILRNGSILVLESTASNHEATKLARYLPDGSLDRSFGSHGAVITHIGDGSFPREMIVLPGGKILVVGTAFVGSTDFITLIRYRPDGSLDRSFATKGVLRAPAALGREGTSVLVQPDGKIVVGGWNQGFMLARYSSGGKNLDPSFDGDGVAGVNGDIGGCGTSSQSGTEGLRLLGGAIIADGECGGGTNPLLPKPYAGILRFDTGTTINGGALDTTFGPAGAALAPFTAPNYDFGVATSHSGGLIQLVEIGYANVHARIGLTAFSSGGIVDSGFGAGGAVSFGLGSTNSDPAGLALARDGKIIVAATDAGDIGTFALIRRKPDGAPDPSFARNDRVVIHVGQAGPGGMSSSGAGGLAMQGDGKVLELGTAHEHGHLVAVLVRFGLAPKVSAVRLADHSVPTSARLKLTYRDSQAATTTVAILRHGHVVRSSSHVDRRGVDHAGVSAHGLAPGRYRLALTPLADGITGVAQTTGFRVV